VTTEEFAAAVKQRMQTVCDEKEKIYTRRGKALPAAATSVRLEVDNNIMLFAKTWEPEDKT